MNRFSISAKQHRQKPGIKLSLFDRFANFVHTSTTAVLILICSLLVTTAAWWISGTYVEKRAKDRFIFRTEDIKLAIANRMRNQEAVLLSGVGLFAASTEVTREDWRQFAEAQEIGERFPGLQGFGFSAYAKAKDRAALEEKVRRDGFPDFAVKPAGERAEYTSIIYLEPFDWRNKRAFGYDMFSEPVRRAAMARARDTGRSAVSDVVKLLQETADDVQAGFLLYLPVYRNGAATGTVAERRDALVGYVYSPFRMKDLMHGILGAGPSDIDFAVHGGPDPSAANLLYASGDMAGTHFVDDGAAFDRMTKLPFAGREWTLHFRAKDNYFSAAEKSQPMMVAACGLAIDVTLFIVILSLSRQRRKALGYADAVSGELRAQVRQNQAIVETVSEGIVIIDTEGMIETINPAATHIFGCQRADLLGRQFVSLLQERDAETLTGDIETYLREGGDSCLPNRHEVGSVRRQGDAFPLEISVSPMRLDGADKFTIALRDLTEQHRMDRMKNEFVSTVSHELRTPLTCLVGALGLARSGELGRLPERVDKLVGLADLNAQRLVTLVNDILDMERIQSNNMDFSYGRMDLTGVAEQVLDELKAYGDKKGVTLDFRPPEGQALVVGDKTRLFQVLSNLVSNAVKFSPEGEVVRVRITRRERTIRVVVEDRGPGIAPEFRSRIFDSFFQVDASDSRNKDGTGLGLSICRAIIAKHGGRIDVEEGPDGGSAFFFELDEIGTQADHKDLAAVALAS